MQKDIDKKENDDVNESMASSKSSSSETKGWNVRIQMLVLGFFRNITVEPPQFLILVGDSVQVFQYILTNILSTLI